MAKKPTVDVAVIIPDASPLLTLARIDRLDLLATFRVPIHIVDQVVYEVSKPEHDPSGKITAFLKRSSNQIQIVETAVGAGFKLMRERDPSTKSSNLGEAAVNEYALRLRRTNTPSFVPMVLFEDPDVLELPIARLAGIYLLNTTAWLFGLHEEGALPEAFDLIDKINAHRHTPMQLIDRDARTKKLRSTWRRRIKNADPS